MRLRERMGAQIRYFRQFILGITLAALGWATSAFAISAAHRQNRPLVVGYITNSSIYSNTPFYVKSMVTSGSASRLDQINYASASVTGGHCSLADPAADLQTPFTAENSVNGIADDAESNFRGYFHQLAELKRRYPRIKIFISLEGRAADFAVDAQPENRVEFVRSCVEMFLRGKLADGLSKPGLFDGIDLDWESPHLEDAANFRALIEELRRQMNLVRPGLKLSIAVDQTPKVLQGTDFREIGRLVDEVGVMNYDYAGPWSATTGLIAPLFVGAAMRKEEDSIETSIAAYRAAGVPARKLLMGIPFYGYGWTGVPETNNGLFQAGRAVRGDRPYSFIRSLAQPNQVFRDQHSQAPWIFDGQNFWTYEDPVSIRYKVSFAANQGLGGVMIWELSGDTIDGELMASVFRFLYHPLPVRVLNRLVDGKSGDSAIAEKIGAN